MDNALPSPRRLVAFFATLVWVTALSAGETPPQAPPAATLQRVTVFPTDVVLKGPRAEQRLGVLGEYSDGRGWDLSRTARIISQAPAVVRVEGAILCPVTDGQAQVIVEAAGKTATVSVRVEGARTESPVSFGREVVPVFTKAGCNGGACHGSQHGRGGFKLSLFGFDPSFDHPQVVQTAEGRRVVLPDPERSLLLLKPTGTVEHGGGERLRVGSRAYRTVLGWLADGAPEPNAKDPSVTRLEIWPPHRVLTTGEQQQLVARATWSDGLVEDVTEVAQYDTLNEAVAVITPEGLMSAKDKGETHIMVRFGGQVAVAQATLPYARTSVPSAPGSPAKNFIDEKLQSKWRDLGLVPSPVCTDEQFLRRAFLDAIGTLPTPAEVKAFLADKAADKRVKLIDHLLNRPEFVDYWSLRWGDLLRINGAQLEDKGMWSFHNWVRASLRDNKPIDQFVREIVTAEGSTFTEGPANFYRTASNPLDWSENVTQIFLGVRVTCAKCHHHPFEKWSQDDYYGMAAFFVRLGTKGSQEFGLFGRETVVYLRPTGEVNHPRKGYVVPPHPLDGDKMDDRFDRRQKLAEWMTAKENPFFARNMVNRFWGYLMGRGLVEPLDDMRATNPPSIPDLLDALARDFAEHQFNLKHLLRTILTSQAYQLDSVATPGNAADTANTYYSRYRVRRLGAEQLADALDAVTATREKYPGLPLGIRAIQLPDTRVRSYLMDVFGRPPRQITCECERVSQPNIAQALHLLNGAFLNLKINSPTGRIDTLLKAKTPVPAVIEELYLATVSRPPRSDEAARARDWVLSAANTREGLQDLLWVLVNSREFLFNH